MLDYNISTLRNQHPKTFIDLLCNLAFNIFVDWNFNLQDSGSGGPIGGVIGFGGLQAIPGPVPVTELTVISCPPGLHTGSLI